MILMEGKESYKIRKIFRNGKGITLIALVVTIVVLIIVATITITTFTQENGIITKAEDTVKLTEIEGIKEQIQTEIISKQAENYGNISDESLEKILKKYGILSEEGNIKDKTLTTNKGNYDIKVSDIFNGTTVEDEPPIFTTVANAPDISIFNKEKTYYVSWDLTRSPYQIDEKTNLNGIAPDNWYDYTAGKNKWANVKTTGGENDCYWVWIPRYAYKVPKKGDKAETIEIKFLQEKSNTPIGETKAIVNTTPTEGSWVVHPAFTKAGNGGFGELTGIWVAKYEASSSQVSAATVTSDLNSTGGGDVTNLQVRVIPNVTSWRNITVGNIFTVCQNLTKTVNNKENSLVGSTNSDAHMIKNTEWGAVAYLSRSIYGKNGQVYKNPYYNSTANHSPITGLCGNAPDYGTNIYNDTNTYKYNTAGGRNASTSGNVYGVYDMAGGAWEYVAGILSGQESTFLNTHTKYYDSYNRYDNTKYGDAVYETSASSSGTTSWDADDSIFVNSSCPVFLRGGRANDGSSAGVFAFSCNAVVTHPSYSFRPCLVSTQQ